MKFHSGIGFGQRTGFSLIEILLVIGIIAVLSLVAFAVYNNTRIAAQTKAQVQQLELITAATSSLYGSRPIDSNIQYILGQMKVIPASSPTNAWQGSLQVWQSSFATSPAWNNCAADKTAIQVWLDQVPAAGCVKLATQLLANPQRTCFMYLYASPGSGSEGSTMLWSAPAQPDLPSPDRIVSACYDAEKVGGSVQMRIGLRP